MCLTDKDAHLVFMFTALKCSAQTIRKRVCVFNLPLGNGLQERKGKTCQILKVFPCKLRAIFSFLMQKVREMKSEVIRFQQKKMSESSLIIPHRWLCAFI